VPSATDEQVAGHRVIRGPRAQRLRPPSWLDGRLVIGVLLIVVSIAAGAKILDSARHYDTVWAAARDLSPGTTLSHSDLTPVKVRFRDHGARYVAGGSDLAGWTVTRPVPAGELIPRSAVSERAGTPVRLITVPIERLRMPRGDVRGALVDVYLTLRTAEGTLAVPQLVIANVTVADVISESSLGGSGGGLVLRVPESMVAAVIAASRSGALDVVRVPTDQATAAPRLGVLASPAGG
jgi:hypothetical protein